MWAEQILLALIGLSAGIVVAGGLFSFIIELGVVADFADRTHTADKILLYEDSVALGGIVGNLFIVFGIPIPYGAFLLPIFGLLAGIFTGCWGNGAGGNFKCFPGVHQENQDCKVHFFVYIFMAIGKGVGAFLFFFRRW